ncbi:tautomerase family protein [Pseudonocardia sp. TRM90224]|uniref:tautomerase family protein n=1 Tax=Pseudonocardia sp. TRM90224 TaxID=2812678 RepID=UPI001E6039D3|nr:tautomerase family protein [Pseudonocardia sp. TRM90224]
MPHVTLHVVEEQVAGREAALIDGLTDVVAEVYGEWARELAVVQLLAVPAGRWAVGGQVRTDPPPIVDFGVRAIALSHPDFKQIIERLAAGVTDVVARIVAEHHRDAVQVNFHFHHDEHTAVGGRLVSDTAATPG